MADYTALATVKLALTVTDAARDTLIAAAITAASRSIDDHTGRRFDLDATATARTFRPQGRTVQLDDGRGELLLVDDIGLATGLVVEVGATGAWTTLDVATLDLDPENALARGHAITGLIRPSGTWRGNRQVRVTARWGWPTVPDQVAQAALIQAQRLYRRKDSPEGVVGSAEWGVIRVARVDPDVQVLLQRFVLTGMA